MKKPIFIAFIALCLVQLYFPAKMILGKEDVLKSGKEFKFKTTPIDTSDLFRGAMVLYFDIDEYPIERRADWEKGETVYLHLSTDSSGFAKIIAATKEKAPENTDYVKARVGQIKKSIPPKIIIDFPFNNYYMEETKAVELYQRISAEANNEACYALVNIKNGNAVLKDLFIKGISAENVGISVKD